MASFVRRAMVYLGLTDDEYDEYDKYDDYDQYERYDQYEGPPGPARAPMQVHRQAPEEEPEHPGGVRTLAREDQAGQPAAGGPEAIVRSMPAEKAKVHVVAPTRFADAQEIGDRLRTDQPVIVNLQVVDRDLSRRMIDFCSGVTYALGGDMKKVADQVFLLTPSNVEVPAEEKQRLAERGLYRAQ